MNRQSGFNGEKIGGWRLVTGHSLGLFILLIAFTGLGLLYDFTVPLFEKPDELKHFAVIQYIQSHHNLPVVQPGVYKAWDQEGTQPPLYHLLAAAATSWLDLSAFAEPPRNPHYVDERSFIWRERGNNNLYLHPPSQVWSRDPVVVAARLSRWLSLLAGAVTVALTYILARFIFTRNYLPATLLPLLTAALVAFIPQFLHVSAAITNDGLSATNAAATLVALALIIQNGGSVRYAFWLGLMLGLGALTKLSLLYLAPLAGLVLLLDWRRHRSFRRFLSQGLLSAGLMLLISGWWYWRNWQLYGDPTALNAHLLYRGGPLDPRPTLAQIWQTELTGLELSFWAAFGAGQILLEPWIYAGLRWVKYVVLLGIMIGVWRMIKWQVASRRAQGAGDKLPATGGGEQAKYNLKLKIQNSRLLILGLLALWTLIIFLALLRWMQITPASWGRLLYPALPAMAVLVVWGLSQFNTQNSKQLHGTPVQGLTTHSWLVPLILVIALFSLAVISPFRYIEAAYAKTPLVTEADLPAFGVERLDFVYDEALRLIGYSVGKPAVQPGDWLPVTLYWQAVRPIEQNYSVFVHLLGQNNVVIGQVNTYPDGGNWPTSMLPPGLVLKDTYEVPVSAEATAPAVIRLAIGIFDFDDPHRRAKPAVDASGQVVEPIVGRIPLLPLTWPELDPTQPLTANFANQIKLVGYDWPQDRHIKPGETVPLTLYWETLAPPGQSLNLFIHLVDPTSQTQVAGFDAPPDYPTSFWQPGNTLIDHHQLAIPTDLPPGEYALQIGWYDLDTLVRVPLVAGSGDSLQLTTITIN